MVWPFSLFRKKTERKRQTLPGTMPFDPSSIPNAHLWRCRVFVSHRWGRDDDFRKKVTSSLKEDGLDVVDLSLTEQERLQGPRGGRIPEVQIKQEISSRIEKSDVVIVPAARMSSGAVWVGWELDEAATQRKPVLFLTEDPSRKHFNNRYRQFKRSGMRVEKATTDPREIAIKVRALMSSSDQHH